MKNLNELDKKLEVIQSQIRYMKQVIHDSNKPDEAKEGAKEALMKLINEEEEILKAIRS